MPKASERRVDVFFYGLFMDKELLRKKGFAPSNERVASVHGFALRIGQRATLIPSVDHVSYGFVMSLSHGDIDALYSETSVRSYRPEAVLARFSDGTSAPALCFNLPDPPGPVVPLPHPSPRNNIWLRKNPWFANDLLPSLRKRVAEVIGL